LIPWKFFTDKRQYPKVTLGARNSETIAEYVPYQNRIRLGSALFPWAEFGIRGFQRVGQQNEEDMIASCVNHETMHWLIYKLTTQWEESPWDAFETCARYDLLFLKFPVTPILVKAKNGFRMTNIDRDKFLLANMALYEMLEVDGVEVA
jgi:hypothetical protein